MKGVFKKTYLRTTVFASFVTLFFFAMQNCSGKNVSSSSSGVGATVPIAINVEADDSYIPPTDSTELNLVSTATNLYAGFSGCTSGNTRISTLISSTINLYKGDRDCVIKLTRFTVGSKTYSNGGANVVDFTTWQVNDVATFQNIDNASDLIKVFVTAQVTQGGVQTSDTVVYKFTDIDSFTTQSLSNVNVQNGVPLSTVSAASPNFTVTQARFLSVNANGSGNLSFTLQCAQSLTGSSLPTYGCADSTVSSNALLQSEIDYIFIPDAYSQGAISWLQAQAAFIANSPTAVGSFIVAPGQQDLNSNTLANGGFYTSTLLTGTTQFSPNNLNYVLMVRRKNASSVSMSYLYFYVTISPTAATSVSACGTSFGSGSGTQADPYVVYDRTTLANTVNCTSSSTYFNQVNDIDLGGSGNPWTAINLFGQYNGLGYKITGLYQNTSSSVGLFATIQDGASVSSLNLQSVDITANNSTGGGLASASLGNISNVSVSGTMNFALSSAKNGGGLLATHNKGTISACSTSVTMTITATAFTSQISFGGLIGIMGAATGASVVTGSYATGNISATGIDGTSYINYGGLIGTLLTNATNNTTISNSYSTGNLTLTSPTVNPLGTRMGFIGVITGAQTSTNIVSGCFSKGIYTITGTTKACQMAGFTGDINMSGPMGVAISNTYSFATIRCGTSQTGPTGAGGFLGTMFTTHTLSTSYSATPEVSATASGTVQGFTGSAGANTTHTNTFMYVNGNVVSQTLTGLTSLTTSTQMQTQGSFTGFDFTTPIWKMPSANPMAPSGLLSPVLAWQCGSNGIVCP